MQPAKTKQAYSLKSFISDFKLLVSNSNVYLQKKKDSFHIVLWNPISQKCLLELERTIIIQLIIWENITQKHILDGIIITCITKALCMLIQKASFSSCFNLLGSTSSNRQISDLNMKEHAY